MPLGVLNNISAVYAENNLNQTQSSLQNVLTQLSSGSRINSGADDPAGLSIANGLQANSAALSQSSSNAAEGVGFLQVADGALSQVTSLLTTAVSLATEAGGGTLSTSQLGAANQEYQDILNQITTIGNTTEYNGITTFSSGAGTAVNLGITGSVGGATNVAPSHAGGDAYNLTDALTSGDTLTGNITISSVNSATPADDASQIINLGNFTGLTSANSGTEATAAAALQTALNAAGGLHGTTGSTYTVADTAGTVSITSSNTADDTLTISASNASETPLSALALSVYTSDGTSSGSQNYVVTVGALTDSSVGTSALGSSNGTAFSSTVNGTTYSGGVSAGGATGGGTSLTGTDLLSQGDAEVALLTADNAINAVAYQRGQVGANINQLSAAANISSSEETNITSAQNTITATDYASATSNMSKYEILTQTGISALAQANSTEQMVTKLLQ